MPIKSFVPETPTEITLIVANILPLWGVMFAGWSVFEVMMLFWFENVIIGVIHVIKMITTAIMRREYGFFVIAPFFVIHYGMFTLGHGFFVLAMFGAAGGGPHIDNDAGWPALLPDLLRGELSPVVPAIAALAASHFFSFLWHFIRGGEVLRAGDVPLMIGPYGRVVVLHITIIIGGGIAMALGNPVWALGLLVVLKTIFDLAAHRRSHRMKPSAKETQDVRQ